MSLISLISISFLDLLQILHNFPWFPLTDNLKWAYHIQIDKVKGWKAIRSIIVLIDRETVCKTIDLSPRSSQMEEKWKKCLNLHKVEHSWPSWKWGSNPENQAPLAGLEPATHGLGIRCPVQEMIFVAKSCIRGWVPKRTLLINAWYAFSRANHSSP